MDTFKIAISIAAPELVEALKSFAEVFKQKALSIELPVQTIPSATIPVAPTTFTAPVPQNAVPMPDPAPQYAPPAPVQSQTPTPTAVPVAPQTYTVDQLAVAATTIADAGRRAELVGLLTKYGAPSLMQLPQAAYGAFAADLRQMGAKI